MKLNKIFYIWTFFCSCVHGQNLNYALHNIHTLTIPKNSYSITYGYQVFNDMLDVLKLKEKKFGNNSSFDTIGDLSGHEFLFRYGLNNDLMLSLENSKASISYGSNDLQNTKYDIFLRYNFFNSPFAKLNSGLSLDVGYVSNELDDFYLRNINEMNSLSQRVTGNTDIAIAQMSSIELQNEKNSIDNLNQLFPNLNIPYPSGYYLTDQNGNKQNLKEEPWLALINTSDESQYLRLLTGYYTKNSVFDIFIGYKSASIKNKITANDELINLAQIQGYNINLLLDRKEKTYFTGINYTIESKEFIYEVGYEYSKFIRESDLDYIDFNHVVDFTINFKISKNFLFFTSAKLLYRQFNGEIPYLYNKYTQSTYDNKYGYTKFGFQYRF